MGTPEGLVNDFPVRERPADEGSRLLGSAVWAGRFGVRRDLLGVPPIGPPRAERSG